MDATTLFARYLAGLESGEEPDFEALCREHPDRARELRELNEDYVRIGPVLEREALEGTLIQKLRSIYGEEIDPGLSLQGSEDPRSDSSSGVLRRLSGRRGGFGRYRLKGEVARGGMGAVLRVWDDDLRRNLAMKVILGKGRERRSGDTPEVDPRLLGRFLEEAQVTGQLDHPGIVPVHELGLDPTGGVYFTMKLVKGQTLKEIFDSARQGDGEWPVSRVLGVVFKVCEAMAYAHDKGVIHRDLKPGNVMVGRFGEVYVMDWGLAKILGRDDGRDIRVKPVESSSALLSDRRDHADDSPESPLYTMDGDVVGTPAYMPPEQALGRLDKMGPHSDVYSVGAMLYHLLAGRMPYVEPEARLNNWAILRMVQAGGPQPLAELAPDTPPPLLAICAKAMSRRWSRRYRNMSELATDLGAFLEGRVVRAYERGSWARAKTWFRRNRALTTALGAAAVFLVVGLVVSTFALRRWANAAELAEVRLGAARENEAAAQASRRDAEEQSRLLELERQEAVKSAERARESEEEARAQTLRANELAAEASRSEAEARRQSYHAHLTSAQIGLYVGEENAARARLADCYEDLRDWEWHNLVLLCDCSYAASLLSGGSWFEFSEPQARMTTSSPGRSSNSSASVPRRVKRTIWTEGSAEGITLVRLKGTKDEVCAAESSNGTLVALGDGSGTIWIRDALSGEVRLELPALGSAVRVLSFGRSVRSLRSLSADGTLCLWDATIGVCHERAVVVPRFTCTAMTGSGDRLAVGTADGRILALDLASGADAREVGRHDGGVLALAFLPDGERLLSSAEDQTVRLWDVDGSAPARRIVEGLSVHALAVDADGSRAAVAYSNRLFVIDLETPGERIAMPTPGTARSLAFSPRGTRLAAGMNGGSVRLWDARTGAGLLTIRGHQSPVYRTVFLSAGERLQTLSRQGLMVLETVSRAERLRAHERASESQLLAEEIVEGLLDAQMTKEEVLRHLESSVISDQETREQARSLARERLFEPQDWVEQAWAIVLAPDAKESQLAQALRWAKRAQGSDLENAGFRCALGGARYRLGQLEAALRDLQRAADADRDDAVAVAFLVLTHAKMGRRNFASASAARLDNLLRLDRWREDEKIRRLLPEVEKAAGRKIGLRRR